VLDALAPVDLPDALLEHLARRGQPGVEHAVDAGIDGRILHAHEIGERVVQVEDDGADHAAEPPRRSAGAASVDAAPGRAANEHSGWGIAQGSRHGARAPRAVWISESHAVTRRLHR